MYLYRALDSAGNTLDFLLNATRSRRAAKRFFRKVLGGKHVAPPRVINVDKNPTYIGAVRDLKREKGLFVCEFHRFRNKSSSLSQIIDTTTAVKLY